MSDDKIEQTFEVTQPARLEVRNICGSIEIRPGEDGKIHVSAIKQPDSGDLQRTEIEVTHQPDGTVRVATRFPDGAWSWMFGSHPCCVDYGIQAPRRCSVKVVGVSNTTWVEGFEGEFDINSVSGEITLHDLTGPVRIHTVSGDAALQRTTGVLDLDTVSGDLAILDGKHSSIKANTVSGNLAVTTALVDGPYKFSSVSGDVRLTLPAETRCTAELRSVSGDLVSAFPGTGYHHHSGVKTIQVQGGGTRVDMNSVSGDLSLDCDGPLPSQAAGSLASSQDRRAVLESVERGEITVEEALVKLQG